MCVCVCTARLQSFISSRYGKDPNTPPRGGDHVHASTNVSTNEIGHVHKELFMPDTSPMIHQSRGGGGPSEVLHVESSPGNTYAQMSVGDAFVPLSPVAAASSSHTPSSLGRPSVGSRGNFGDTQFMSTYDDENHMAQATNPKVLAFPDMDRDDNNSSQTVRAQVEGAAESENGGGGGGNGIGDQETVSRDQDDSENWRAQLQRHWHQEEATRAVHDTQYEDDMDGKDNNNNYNNNDNIVENTATLSAQDDDWQQQLQEHWDAQETEVASSSTQPSEKPTPLPLAHVHMRDVSSTSSSITPTRDDMKCNTEYDDRDDNGDGPEQKGDWRIQLQEHWEAEERREYEISRETDAYNETRDDGVDAEHEHGDDEADAEDWRVQLQQHWEKEDGLEFAHANGNANRARSPEETEHLQAHADSPPDPKNLKSTMHTLHTISPTLQGHDSPYKDSLHSISPPHDAEFHTQPHDMRIHDTHTHSDHDDNHDDKSMDINEQASERISAVSQRLQDIHARLAQSPVPMQSRQQASIIDTHTLAADIDRLDVSSTSSTSATRTRDPIAVALPTHRALIQSTPTHLVLLLFLFFVVFGFTPILWGGNSDFPVYFIESISCQETKACEKCGDLSMF